MTGSPLRTHFIGSNISGGSLLAANTIVLYTFLEFSRDIMLPDRALRVLLNGVQVLPRDATLH